MFLYFVYGRVVGVVFKVLIIIGFKIIYFIQEKLFLFFMLISKFFDVDFDDDF